MNEQSPYEKDNARHFHTPWRSRLLSFDATNTNDELNNWSKADLEFVRGNVWVNHAEGLNDRMRRTIDRNAVIRFSECAFSTMVDLRWFGAIGSADTRNRPSKTRKPADCRRLGFVTFPAMGGEQAPRMERRVLQHRIYERTYPNFPSEPEVKVTPENSDAMKAAYFANWNVYDPMMPKRVMSDPVSKIAAAIERLADEIDSNHFRRLLRMGAVDPDAVVRRAVARAAHGMIGDPEIAELLTGMGRDDETDIRQIALAALLRFHHRPEMHRRLATFIRAPEPQVRLAVLTALAEHDVDPDIPERLIGRAFDPDGDVRRLARWIFTPVEIGDAFNEICRSAENGEGLSLDEIMLLATDPTLSPADRAKISRARLEEQSRCEDETAARDTLRAIGYGPGPVPPALWEAVA